MVYWHCLLTMLTVCWHSLLTLVTGPFNWHCLRLTDNVYGLLALFYGKLTQFTAYWQCLRFTDDWLRTLLTDNFHGLLTMLLYTDNAYWQYLRFINGSLTPFTAYWKYLWITTLFTDNVYGLFTLLTQIIAYWQCLLILFIFYWQS